jgi:hypothetical protein
MRPSAKTVERGRGGVAVSVVVVVVVVVGSILI